MNRHTRAEIITPPQKVLRSTDYIIIFGSGMDIQAVSPQRISEPLRGFDQWDLSYTCAV